MSGTKLVPEKITSPFQLMAAWFSMLVLLVGVLLTAAAQIEKPEWAAGYLVVFTSVVVLLVILCVALMLTKFRPHLQEGKEYAQWLKDKGAYSSGRIARIAGSSVKPAAISTSNIAAPSTASSTAVRPRKNGVLVSVSDLAGATDITESLKNKGFNVEIFTGEMSKKETHSEHLSIWVGNRIQPSIVIEALNVALSVWPHLKYLELSGDGSTPPDYVHDQLFIGGSTSTALDRGLKPWSVDEIKSLKANMSLEDFHAAIRSKY